MVQSIDFSWAKEGFACLKPRRIIFFWFPRFNLTLFLLTLLMSQKFVQLLLNKTFWREWQTSCWFKNTSSRYNWCVLWIMKGWYRKRAPENFCTGRPLLTLGPALGSLHPAGSFLTFLHNTLVLNLCYSSL